MTREAQEMKRLYVQERQSIKRIGDHFERSYSTVHRVLSDVMGVQLRRPHRNSGVTSRRTPHAEMIATVQSYRRTGNMTVTAAEMGLCSSVVRRRLDQAGEPVRPRAEVVAEAMQQRRTPPERAAQFVQAYRDGMSVKEVAQSFGTSTTTVYKVLDAAGVSRRSPSESVALYWRRKHEREAAEVSGTLDVSEQEPTP